LSVAEKSWENEPLPFVHDKHGGVIIEMTTPMDPAVFSASLKAALSKWREQVIPLNINVISCHAEMACPKNAIGL